MTAAFGPSPGGVDEIVFYALRVTETGHAPESNHLQFVTKFRLFPQNEEISVLQELITISLKFFIT